MILLYAAMNLPLVIWMMRSFFAEMPREIIEASQIDGASFAAHHVLGGPAAGGARPGGDRAAVRDLRLERVLPWPST